MLVPFGPVSNDIITAALRKEGFTEDLQQALGAGQGNPDLVRELVLRGTLPLLEQTVKNAGTAAESFVFYTVESANRIP